MFKRRASGNPEERKTKPTRRPAKLGRGLRYRGLLEIKLIRFFFKDMSANASLFIFLVDDSSPLLDLKLLPCCNNKHKYKKEASLISGIMTLLTLCDVGNYFLLSVTMAILF